jgi:DNA polymerase-4
MPFLAPLPLALLPGIAMVDLHRLQQVNIRKVHQAAALSVQELSVLCDHRARLLYQTLRGIDPTPVHPGTAPGAGCTLHHTFAPDTNQEALVRAALTTLVQQAGYGLRQQQLGCRRVAVSLLYTDGVEVIRQAVTNLPASDDPALEQLALTALYRSWHRRVRLRQIALACSKLQHPVQQLSLFAAIDPRQQKNQRLSEAFDAIHQRCGSGMIYRGRQQPTATAAQ